MHLLVTRIEWDTDGVSVEECALPETVIVFDAPDTIGNLLEYEEAISQSLSEAFGFCHNGFQWERFCSAADTHAGGGYFPRNLGLCPYREID